MVTSQPPISVDRDTVFYRYKGSDVTATCFHVLDVVWRDGPIYAAHLKLRKYSFYCWCIRILHSLLCNYLY
jgi:hypothetical protein